LFVLPVSNPIGSSGDEEGGRTVTFPIPVSF